MIEDCTSCNAQQSGIIPAPHKAVTMGKKLYRGVLYTFLTFSIAPMAIADESSSPRSGVLPVTPPILDAMSVRGKAFSSSAKPTLPEEKKTNEAEKTEKLPFEEIAPVPEKLQDLKNISFKSLSPVAFYQKSYFSWIVLSGTILVSCVVTYFSAGAGAPAAATGVSTVASWIAGGGAGSYMTGLATVGSCIGGNAMAGAAILNGISFALGGTVAKGVTSVILSAALFTATMLDGVAPLMKPEGGRLHYTVRINPPADTGSVSVRKLVREMQDVREKHAKILKTMSSQDAQSVQTDSLKSVSTDFTSLMIDARDMLKNGIESNNLSTSDLLVLGVINYGSGEENSLKLFQSAVARIAASQSKINNSGYLYYLMAISCLCECDEKSAMNFLNQSISQEPYAIEPAALKLNLFAAEFPDTEPRARMTLRWLSQNFSTNEYKSDMTMIAPYFRMATICYKNGMFKESEEFYSKAHREIGLIEKTLGDPSLRREIQLGIMNSLFKMGETQKANNMYSDVAKNLKYSEEKKLRERYAGN